MEYSPIVGVPGVCGNSVKPAWLENPWLPTKTKKFSRSSNINGAVWISVNEGCRVDTESFLLLKDTREWGGWRGIE